MITSMPSTTFSHRAILSSLMGTEILRYGNGVAEDASDAISVDEGDWIGLSDGD
jgi:hypothetical protein